MPGLWWSATVAPAEGSPADGAGLIDWEAMDAPVGECAGALLATIQSGQSGAGTLQGFRFRLGRLHLLHGVSDDRVRRS